jgi:glutamate racemase
VARVGSVMASLIERHGPDLAVIACNTASTLVLPRLRAAFPDLPFVGTVPAIKPAAEASLTRLVSVLATPGTVARDYTRALVRDFAGNCEVTLVGSTRLAGLAELFLRGEAIDDAEVASEIAPCFVERGDRRTDHVVLACTHFPLLMEHFVRLAPWPVDFVDPAPAIARRVDALLGERGAPRGPQAISPAIFTSGRPPSVELQKALRRHGLAATSAGERAAAT